MEERSSDWSELIARWKEILADPELGKLPYPEGETVSECPVSTAGGVRAVDVAWLAPDRAEIGQDPIVFVRAPDICVEGLSPSNTSPETDEKRLLYFDAGASEVWICNLDGSITFFVGPDHQQDNSVICPAFRNRIP